MSRIKSGDLADFHVVGINYQKTDAGIRGEFAINSDQYLQILEDAANTPVKEFFILSTCNRTEIYGLAENPAVLASLLCTRTSGSASTFMAMAYTRKGMDAVTHLFEVAAGLDSQILGDYEVVGQIRQAVKLARGKGFIHSFLERLSNQVLKSSKSIKNQTAISDGTVSVSFAAVQYLKEKIKNPAAAKMLIMGIGKIGRVTCKNVREYLPMGQITLVNRTDEKSAALAEELGFQFAPYSDLPQHIRESQVILVATNAPEPVLLARHLEQGGEKLILDLSIPFNVDKQVAGIPGISLLTVDELSRQKDETIQKRMAEIPKVLSIIKENLAEFSEWLDMQKHVVILRAIKTKLHEIHSTHILVDMNSSRHCLSPEDQIQRVINGMAPKIRSVNQPCCHYLEAINEYIATGTH